MDIPYDDGILCDIMHEKINSDLLIRMWTNSMSIRVIVLEALVKPQSLYYQYNFKGVGIIQQPKHQHQ